MRRKLVAGNWKMNGTAADLDQLRQIAQAHSNSSVDILICPPATLLSRAASIGLPVGGQDCHANRSGAHTGDISADMLRDAGASAVIVGHSERRADHDEDDDDIRAKARAAQAAGLTTIVCVGESLSQREADNTLDIIGAQLAMSVPDDCTGDTLIIAYEPIWAIGTGKIPTLHQISEVHDFIHEKMKSRFGDAGDDITILYGGSVKASNAADIFAVNNVDGALVGGASLKADDFSPIISALENA